MKHIDINDKRYQIVTLDFETYYASDYTLSGKSMNMSEYIRDPRFHAHGVAIKIGNQRTKWYTGKNIYLAIKAIDWKRSALLCHNTAFDGFILSHWYDVVAGFYLDTLSMSRAVHGHHLRHDLDSLAKRHGLAGKVLGSALVNTKGKLQLTPDEKKRLGAYAINDADDTWQVFQALYGHFPDNELRLVDVTLRMFCDPKLLVDIPRVQAELDREIGSKAAALKASGADPSDLMSNPKFAALLTKAGAKLPMKISLTTQKSTFAFAKSDLDFQELAKSSNPKVAALCAARLKVKSTIGETRAVRFLEAVKDGMRLPVLLNYFGAHTGRWSGGNKCLSGDTKITVLRDSTQCDILISQLLLTDKVWDGEEFVEHEGLIDQGEQEVIEHDGVVSTPDHEVFTEEGRLQIREARDRGVSILVGRRPCNME
jgi:hypothetical protein